ncbi:MAG: hypothetical protein IJR85_09475 [Synergistaceae bacterium]|nr:hypothetical protein [Synergistaceae bacterium]
MKKLAVAVVMLAMFAASSHAEVIGTLTRSNTGTQESMRAGAGFRASDSFAWSLLSQVLDAGIDPANASLRFYDSVAMMQLALERGDVGAITREV